jgi:hypothetical protein
MPLVKELVMPVVVATSLALGAFAQGGIPRPDPRGEPSGTPSATSASSTPVATAGPGCDMVIDYYRDLNRALFRADEFFNFLGDDSVTFTDLSEREATQIVDSGEALIADLEDLDVPPAYADGNDGIIALMQVNVDFVKFYVLDSSTVPNLNDIDTALEQIYYGEVDIAEACPDEVDEIGGYVMYDPDELANDLDIEATP